MDSSGTGAGSADWRGGFSTEVGPEFGWRHPERRGITVLLEYLDGSLPFGQSDRDVTSCYGLAVRFDF